MKMIFEDSEGAKWWFVGGKWKQYSDYLKYLLHSEWLKRK